MIFIGIDEPLWLKHEQNMSSVVQLAQDHVDELNKIFIEQVQKVVQNYTSLVELNFDRGTMLKLLLLSGFL
jgi:hypothetical protein